LLAVFDPVIVRARADFQSLYAGGVVVIVTKDPISARSGDRGDFGRTEIKQDLLLVGVEVTGGNRGSVAHRVEDIAIRGVRPGSDW
jgi:hypothetical protein